MNTSGQKNNQDHSQSESFCDIHLFFSYIKQNYNYGLLGESSGTVYETHYKCQTLLVESFNNKNTSLLLLCKPVRCGLEIRKILKLLRIFFFFLFSMCFFNFLNYFIVVQIQLSAFTPHYSTQPQPCPPPSPASTTPPTLGFAGLGIHSNRCAIKETIIYTITVLSQACIQIVTLT